MPLLQHHINELKSIHKREFREELPNAEAWAMAQRLVNLLRLLINHETDGADSYLRKKINRV